jgi:hypothetical protein
VSVTLVLGDARREMCTNDAVPRVGDVVEFDAGVRTVVCSVHWLLSGRPHYQPGYITHSAIVTLAAIASAPGGSADTVHPRSRSPGS